MDKNIKRDDIFVIRHLLENGENPNSRQGLVSYLICSYYSSDLTEKLINEAKLLVEYEAKFTDMDLRECDVVARTTGVSEKRVQLIKDIRRHGVKESLNLWSKPDEYFEVSVAREKEEKERKK